MKAFSLIPRTAQKSPVVPFEPSSRRIKVSLHQLVNDLLASLQPLAMKRNNVVLNGIPEGLCFVAEENLMAYILWNMLNTVVSNKKNECIHVLTLVDDDRTMICVRDAGTYLYRSLAPEYRKLQDAAERVGGCINVYNDLKYGSNIVFCISNTRMAV
ncbi:MAG: HAMP domain-containing histidine kinase [Bacteroidetes bacterium]|nr:HAMP domain-containing histidine kinase [Bacteroidota bacterium]